MRHFLIAFFVALAALVGAALVLPPQAATPGVTQAAPQPKSRAPQASYDVNDWVRLHSAASLAGALQRCAESGDHPNRTHERITRVFNAVLKALDKGNDENKQMWQLATRAHMIGHQRGVYATVVPDPSDGGVKFGDPADVSTPEACKAAEAVALKMLDNGGPLDMSVGDEA